MNKMNDIELKNKGNKYFAARKYEDAIRCYSEAIAAKPSVSIYHTNRALSYLKCRRYDKVCQDCRSALEIDPMQVKAHFFLGQALLESQNYDESIRHLQRAGDLAKEQKVNYGDDIAALIRVARKRRFAVAEEARIAQEIDLQTYLNRLILEDRDKQLQQSSHTVTNTLIDSNKENRLPQPEHDTSTPLDDKPPSHQSQPVCSTQLSAEDVTKQAEDRLLELNGMFAKLDERRRKREVPDYLCGKISFDILREPVVTPSGITYDRKDIEEHLQRVGHFDPITRTSLAVDQLVPNLAIKEVVDDFLQANEWAIDY